MAGRVAVFAAAFACAIAPATAWAAAPDPGGNEEAVVPVPPPNGQAFGFNDHSFLHPEFDIPPATIAQITQDAGANIQRITVNWQEVEPEQNVSSEAAWDRYEEVYHAFKARGQRLLITLSPAPTWARDVGVPRLCFGGLSCTYPPADYMLNEWADYVREVVRRFPGSVIETWNEPNIDAFWMPYPQPARFAKLHATTYHAAKSVDPSATVLMGGLAGTVSSDGRQEVTVRKFLSSAYATGKLDNTVDALSIHLYTNNERPMGPTTLFAQSLFDIRQARDAAGQQRKKIWVTETGLSTSGNWAISAEKQADGLIRRYKRLMTMDDIGGMIIHTAVDQFERAKTDRAYGFGLVSSVFPLIVKPAYCEFAGRASASPPAGCKRIVDKPGGGGSGNPVLDDLIDDAPKTLRTKAKSRCRTWSKELTGWSRAAKPKRKRMVLSCVGRYIAVHIADNAALKSDVLKAPRKVCKRKTRRAAERAAASNDTLSRSTQRRMTRQCTGRRSIRALKRLYAAL